MSSISESVGTMAVATKSSQSGAFARGAAVLSAVLALIASIVAGPAVGADFKLTDTNGTVHTLKGYRGKWVLVNFWASWCPPCLEEIPELVALHDAHAVHDLVVIGIVTDDDDRAAVATFVRKHHIDYPVVFGTDDDARQFQDITGLPTSLLFDPKGTLAWKRVGPVTRRQIEAVLSRK